MKINYKKFSFVIFAPVWINNNIFARLTTYSSYKLEVQCRIK